MEINKKFVWMLLLLNVNLNSVYRMRLHMYALCNRKLKKAIDDGAFSFDHVCEWDAAWPTLHSHRIPKCSGISNDK